MTRERIQIPPQEPDIQSTKEMLIETYGSDSDKEFDELRQKHPEWSLKRAVEEFEETPTNQQTNFFRTHNLKYTAKELVPKLEQKEEPVKILVIGCSSGEEVYSLGVHMFDEGRENFEIKGIDTAINPLSVAEMGEYKIWADSIGQVGGIDYSHLTQDHIKNGYFKDSGKRWDKREHSGKYTIEALAQMIREKRKIPDDAWITRPQLIIGVGEKLKHHTSFEAHDMLDGPVEGQYNIVIMNHVLIHYPANTAERILTNALKSLRPGGFVVLESKMSPMNDHERDWLTPYNDWRGAITEKFPLELIKDGKGYSTGQYFRFLGFK